MVNLIQSNITLHVTNKAIPNVAKITEMNATIQLNKFKVRMKIMYSAVTVTNVNARVRCLRGWKTDVQKIYQLPKFVTNIYILSQTNEV